jgi:hypothetical protein
VSKDVSVPRDFHSLLLESDVLREEEIETEQSEDETGNEEKDDLRVVTVEEMEEVV